MFNHPTTITITIKPKGKNKPNRSEVCLATSELSNTFEARTASILVLGTKFLAGLTKLEIDFSNIESESLVETIFNDDASNAEGNKLKKQGLISHATASPHPTKAQDLQFFNINGRPVDLPSVSPVLGDCSIHPRNPKAVPDHPPRRRLWAVDVPLAYWHSRSQITCTM